MSAKSRDAQIVRDRYLATNRRWWDSFVEPHFASPYYGVKRFLNGESSLLPVEREEIGSVRGRRLLHLMCHFGLDTLSWVRLGARVTGVDFAPLAIRRARALAREAGLPATFVRSELGELPRKLRGLFDIVFTSYGVLPWLPDLNRWAGVVARYVRPGGFFYLVEDHPVTNVFEWNRRTRQLELRRSYFGAASPTKVIPTGSYAVRSSGPFLPAYEWAHSISDVLNALRSAGLSIEFIHEFPFMPWRRYPPLRERQDGYFELPRQFPPIPLMFSVKASRPLSARPS
jgi:SAM-dependent methyltransferase